MNEAAFIIAVAFGAAIVEITRRAYTPILSWQADENMPRVLRNSKLYGSEFQVEWHGTVGIIDQAYQASSHKVVLVDTKSRRSDTVRQGDIWQLSLYRTLLSKSKRVTVSKSAFVRVVYAPHGDGSRKVHYQKVRLHSSSAVISKYDL